MPPVTAVSSHIAASSRAISPAVPAALAAAPSRFTSPAAPASLAAARPVSTSFRAAATASSAAASSRAATTSRAAPSRSSATPPAASPRATKNKYLRKCHDCGRPTHNYRCHKCWIKVRADILDDDDLSVTPFDEIVG